VERVASEGYCEGPKEESDLSFEPLDSLCVAIPVYSFFINQRYIFIRLLNTEVLWATGGSGKALTIDFPLVGGL
jgi:hypothetical protein